MRGRQSCIALAAGLAALVLLTPLSWAHDSGFGLVRYTSQGALDASFGKGGMVVVRAAQSSFVANALALQPDGEVVLGGLTSDIASGTLQVAVARYNSDGTPDAAFSTNGITSAPVGDAGGQANALAIQPDGRIVITGTAFSHGGPDRILTARYTHDGALDSTFGTDGFALVAVGAGASSASAVALQPDGDIVVVGTAFSNGATDDDFALVRYTPDGRLDPTFGRNGFVTTDFGSGHTADASIDHATAVVVQPDAKLIVGGFTRGPTQSFATARYNPDGSLDTRFGHEGLAQIPAPEPQVSSIALQPSGDIVLAGSSVATNRATTPFVFVRLHGDGTPDASFGGNGLVTTSFDGSRSGVRTIALAPDGRLIGGGAKFGAPSASGDALPDSGFALARFNADGSLDTSFGTDGRAISSLGDAGAVPLALAVQPDGKVIVAGLIFFQVPTSPQPGPLSVPVLLAVSIALACAAGGAAFLFSRFALRRGRESDGRPHDSAE